MFSTVLISEPVAQGSGFLRMSYHLFETANVPPATLAIMVSVFDEVCEQLRLSPVQDRLRDIVAQSILDCVRKGRIDQDELRACALQLRNSPNKSSRPNGCQPGDDAYQKQR